MAEVNITLNGRIYEIACDQGQEGRVVDLAAFIDQRLQQISRSGAAYNDAHLMVLTALVLADELFEVQEGGAAKAPRAAAPVAAPAAPERNPEEELALVKLLDQMAKRIDGIAQRVQSA
ncbi:MAG: cell division protein ZapA [Micavibrio sp.]|nr:cell division protein ZapA [Micavibrio sp.]